MTKIEWTNRTWNPIAGCSKVSEGCYNCYAERMTFRLSNMIKPFNYYEEVITNGKWNGRLYLDIKKINIPLTWKKSSKVFVCSMSDLFNQKIRPNWIYKIFKVMEKCPQHTFQVLTKRAEEMFKWYKHYWYREPTKNIWLGVTAENQEQADKRTPCLLKTPAILKFISCEPLLGKIDLELYLRSGIDWVICGCESGSSRRETKIEWIRSLRDQCAYYNIPFFLKQMDINGKLVKMPKLDGVVHNAMPDPIIKVTTLNLIITKPK